MKQKYFSKRLSEYLGIVLHTEYESYMEMTPDQLWSYFH